MLFGSSFHFNNNTYQAYLPNFLAGLHARARVATYLRKFGNPFIPEILVITWPYARPSVQTLVAGEGIQESAHRGGWVCHSVAPWLRKFSSIHSRNVDSKLVWDDIAHSRYQVTGVRWPVLLYMTLSRVEFRPTEITCFFSLPLTSFQLIAGSRLFFKDVAHYCYCAHFLRMPR